MLKPRRLVYQFLSKTKIGVFILNLDFKKRFITSSAYWENRYSKNGNSGIGSYGALADYKASVINNFIREKKIGKVIEFGCGDGNQLQQFEIDTYIGLDVSATAIENCKHIFKDDPSKSFFIYSTKGFSDSLNIFSAGLTLSLDVIYHLLEDDVFESYIIHLFSASTNFVIIYAWDLDAPRYLHVKHRKFTTWIDNNLNDWQLQKVIKNTYQQKSACDFFIYKRFPKRD